MNKNILYLSYDGMTDPLGQSQVIPYLQGLSKKGYHFTLLSFEKTARYKQNGALIKQLFDESKIEWVPLKYHKFPPVLSTLLDLWIMRVKAKQLHRQQPFDVIHCRSYLSALIGLRMKKKYGVKFLFDMRGFWADERVEGGIWNLKNPIYKLIYSFFKSKEKTFFEQSDYTISLTENAKREIHTWENISTNPIPIQVIPCCADLHLFKRKNSDEKKSSLLKQKLGIKKNEFVLLYLGSLGTWYMLEEMLDFFKILLQYKPEARFLLVTKDTPDIVIVLASAKLKRIEEEKLVITSTERQDMPKYLALADLSVFFIKPVFSKKASSPTKQGELMGMGIPIVCNADVGDTGEIIQQTGAGAVIEEFNEKNYRKVCENLKDILLTDPNVIRSGAQQYYSLEKGVEAYSQVYEKLL